MAWPWFLALLAEACGKVGQLDEGLRALEEALAAVQHNAEGYYEVEVYRLKGELLLQVSPAHQEEAEEHFQQALAVARRRQAKSWELRAATSLSRLWQRQGKRAEARTLLAPSTAGLPRALTPLTCRTLERYCESCSRRDNHDL